jgi:hypothetical protein
MPHVVASRPALALHPVTNGRPLLLRGVNGAEKSYRTITQEFLHDLHETWKVHGKTALETVATERPSFRSSPSWRRCIGLSSVVPVTSSRP